NDSELPKQWALRPAGPDCVAPLLAMTLMSLRAERSNLALPPPPRARRATQREGENLLQVRCRWRKAPIAHSTICGGGRRRRVAACCVAGLGATVLASAATSGRRSPPGAWRWQRRIGSFYDDQQVMGVGAGCRWDRAWPRRCGAGRADARQGQA